MPGLFTDLTMFRLALKGELLAEKEKDEADRGYIGEETICNTDMCVYREGHRVKMRAQFRHETVNGCLKFFNCFTQKFLHTLDKHHIVFQAVVVVVQISFENGEPPFKVK